jgi:kynurenine formamidase
MSDVTIRPTLRPRRNAMNAAPLHRWVGAVTVTLVGVTSFALGTLWSGRAGGTPRLGAPPGFAHVVFLGHVNDPRETPGFPGDPRFALRTVFTVERDGFYLRYVTEGEHTGTHYSTPCHFHDGARCAPRLRAGDFVLPAVILDVRAQVAEDVDYEVSLEDLEAWSVEHGPMPQGSAVIAWTGCSEFWGPERGPVPSYYNCGTGRTGFHQPGFSFEAVRWLIDRGVLGETGALGTDTFGPDPGTDARFRESSATLRRHRFTLENLTNLDAMPPAGGWIVIGGPRNAAGSGAASTIFGLVP